MVPVELRPEVLQTYWEVNNTEPGLLAPYWPATPAQATDNIIRAGVTSFTRKRGRRNSRFGQPNVVEPYDRGKYTIEAETWREAIPLPPELGDMSEPGQATGLVPANEVERAVKQLRNRYDRWMEWLRASAFMGVKHYFPPGMDTEYHELLLCSDECIFEDVPYDWSTPPVDQDTARTTLIAIMADIRFAKWIMAFNGTTLTHMLMNSWTAGYIEDNAIASGAGALFDYVSSQIATQGQVARFMGITILIDDNIFVQPIVNWPVQYIPNDVVIFFDENNARAQREMVECRPVGDSVLGPPPMTARGLWWPSYYYEGNTPKTLYVPGEWTGQPLIGLSCGQVVLTDVTDTGD